MTGYGPVILTVAMSPVLTVLTVTARELLIGGGLRPRAAYVWAVAGGVGAFPAYGALILLLMWAHVDLLGTGTSPFYWTTLLAQQSSWHTPPLPGDLAEWVAAGTLFVADTLHTIGIPLWVFLGLPLLVGKCVRRDWRPRRGLLFAWCAAVFVLSWYLVPSARVRQWLIVHPDYNDTGQLLWEVGVLYVWGCSAGVALYLRQRRTRGRSTGDRSS
jgi:hypothetical protein